MKPNWTVVGALWGFLGVACGAFGAHGLEARVSAEQLEWWRTGATYHLLHAPALIVFGLLEEVRGGRGGRTGWLFLLGSLVFSGSLYAMTLGAPTTLGAVTPLGGLLLLSGWIAFAFASRRPS